MPNSYTVFPGVILGNVTITGNLTVSGDQVRIGAAIPYVRIGKRFSNQAMHSLNLQFDAATRDDSAATAIGLFNNTTGSLLETDRSNTAGTIRAEAAVSAILTDYTDHTHTGTVTEDTIYSKLIPANTLGPNGGLLLRFWILYQVQGATASTLRVKLGGVAMHTLTFTTTGNRLFEVVLTNRNAASSQISRLSVITVDAGTIGGQTPGGGAVDTALDQTLALTIQNGATTDSQQFRDMHVSQLNSFGPV